MFLIVNPRNYPSSTRSKKSAIAPATLQLDFLSHGLWKKLLIIWWMLMSTWTLVSHL